MCLLRSLLSVCFLSICITTSPGAFAGSKSCDTRVNNTHKKLLECVTIDGTREHQAALQAIADNNGGIRTSGTPGYDESVDYVVERMTAAGYDVVVQPFEFSAFIELGVKSKICCKFSSARLQFRLVNAGNIASGLGFSI